MHSFDGENVCFRGVTIQAQNREKLTSLTMVFYQEKLDCLAEE
jgi:hypothetical protein